MDDSASALQPRPLLQHIPRQGQTHNSGCPSHHEDIQAPHHVHLLSTEALYDNNIKCGFCRAVNLAQCERSKVTRREYKAAQSDMMRVQSGAK